MDHTLQLRGNSAPTRSPLCNEPALPRHGGMFHQDFVKSESWMLALKFRGPSTQYLGFVIPNTSIEIIPLLGLEYSSRTHLRLFGAAGYIPTQLQLTKLRVDARNPA